MKTKLIISILTITSLLFLTSCEGFSRKDAIFLGVGAALIGGMALYDYMNSQDKMILQDVLENSPDGQTIGWQNPETNNLFQTTTTNTSINNGRPCRQYQTVGIINGRKETMVGTACRQPNGFWQIR